jgi:hypothetical protein
VVVFISLASLKWSIGGENMELKSPEFKNDQFIPAKFTCEGENVNPPLVIEGIPPDSKSMVLIVDDPDAVSAPWVHWLVFNIPPDYKIEEDSIPGEQGINSAGETDWHGPCPPSGIHRYFFKIYALDKMLSLKESVNKKQIEEAMQGHILDSAQLLGRYKRNK